MDSSNQRVKRKLADRYSESAHSLITEPKDPFTIGDHDNIYLWVRTVTQKFNDRVAQRIGNDESSRATINVTEKLAGQTDRRRVDDGHHFLDMIEHQVIKQRLVRILELTQIDVSFQICRLRSEGFVRPDGLFRQRLNSRR
jgi:hypothetical protein